MQISTAWRPGGDEYQIDLYKSLLLYYCIIVLLHCMILLNYKLKGSMKLY